MATFDTAVLDACANEREVDLTTWGRVSGAPRRVTLYDDHLAPALGGVAGTANIGGSTPMPSTCSACRTRSRCATT